MTLMISMMISAPLNNEEEVEAGPDGQRYVEITVMGVEVDISQPESINIL